MRRILFVIRKAPPKKEFPPPGNRFTTDEKPEKQASQGSENFNGPHSRTFAAAFATLCLEGVVKPMGGMIRYRFLDIVDEFPMPRRIEFEVTVNQTLGTVFNKNPQDAVKPD